jgi:hypothetical protein
MNIPLTSTMIRPGARLAITDNRFASGTTILMHPNDTWYAHLRDVVFDFAGKKITMEGEFSNFLDFSTFAGTVLITEGGDSIITESGDTLII